MRILPVLALIVSCLVTPPSLSYDRFIYIPRSVTIYSQQYDFSSENIAALAGFKNSGVKLKVAQFRPASGDDGSMLCRGWFPIVPTSGVSFSEFVKTALTNELTEAGIYSENDGLELSVQVESIDFNSFGSGKWTYRATLATLTKGPQVFSYEHPFDTPFTAAAACRAVASAFVPGVQGFLRAIYADPRFHELLVSKD